MASSSRFRYNSKRITDHPPHSAFKWSAPASNAAPIVVTSSKPSTSWKSSTRSSRWSNGTQNMGTSKLASSQDGVLKIVDSERIRTVPIRQQSMPASERSLIANGRSIESCHTRYDPTLRTLIRTVSFQPTLVSALVSAQTATSIKGRTTPKKAVSRYKVVRNCATETQPSRRNKGSKPPSTTPKKTAGPESPGILKIISKYKIQRRRLNSASSPRKKIREFAFDSKRRRSGGISLVNQYHVVRIAAPTKSSKTLYKIDRRQKKPVTPNARESRHSGVRNATMYHLRRNSTPRTAKRKVPSQPQQDRQCLFFVRYGRCCRGSSCPLIHDPSKVAVCTRFLRGTCKVRDCPFSHVVSPDKMPLCRFFLLGKCVRSDCPYLHVKHASTAQNCADFERGFCPKGAKCDKKHTARCNNHFKTATANEEKPKSLLKLNGERSKDCNRTGLLLPNSLRCKLAARAKHQVIDLSAGPLPEFIPLVKSGTS